MDNGGYAAMLHDLLNHNLTFFNHRSGPVTAGLHQQRKLSLPSAEAWWLDVLHRGYVWKSKLGLDEYFGQWHNEATTELLFAAYNDFADRAKDRHPLGREAFGRFIKRVGGQPRRLANAAVGEHIRDVDNAYGGTNRKAAVIKHLRPCGYHLGSLSSTREAFVRQTKLTVEWDLDV